MSKHSPFEKLYNIPWSVESNGHGGYLVNDNQKQWVADIIEEEDADLIVLAVNSHDKLVELLTELRWWSVRCKKHCDGYDKCSCGGDSFRKRITEALASVEVK